MTAAILQLPGAELPRERPSLNLTVDEVRDASGGYVRPADQLRALHDLGFVQAFRGKSGNVILPRAHYDAILRGQYGQREPANEPRAPLPPNIAGLKRKFGKKTGA